jgi:nitrite reductase/ring-hydroxylating ferredoxin subunit/uncharacterized membrane protein
MLKRLLEGKPFGHPLHPILVHLPIGLFLISFAFDVGGIINQFAPPDHFIAPAFYTMFLGVLAALVAAVPGFVDYLDIRRDHPARRTATYHMWLNLLVVAIYIINLAVRYHRLGRSAPMVMPVVLSFCALVALGVSGYLGGVLIYDDGIAVGRHRRAGKTPKRTLDLSDRAATDGFIEVAKDADLEDRQTLRVRAGGIVMAIAKADGQVYAFQDFCTHRFGPLSEGSFANGQVTCPWHGSCFDMVTGQVCHGPAKEPLRTFEVQIRDGLVLVRVPTTDGKSK